MRMFKMLEVLNQFAGNNDGALMHGTIYATGGGELAISPKGQPSRETHAWLLKKGFVFIVEDGDYIYRPR